MKAVFLLWRFLFPKTNPHSAPPARRDPQHQQQPQQAETGTEMERPPRHNTTSTDSSQPHLLVVATSPTSTTACSSSPLPAALLLALLVLGLNAALLVAAVGIRMVRSGASLSEILDDWKRAALVVLLEVRDDEKDLPPPPIRVHLSQQLGNLWMLLPVVTSKNGHLGGTLAVTFLFRLAVAYAVVFVPVGLVLAGAHAWKNNTVGARTTGASSARGRRHNERGDDDEHQWGAAAAPPQQLPPQPAARRRAALLEGTLAVTRYRSDQFRETNARNREVSEEEEPDLVPAGGSLAEDDRRLLPLLKDDDPPTCPICLLEIQDRQWVTSCGDGHKDDDGGCSSLFHKDCLFDWLLRYHHVVAGGDGGSSRRQQYNSSCPCCRKELVAPTQTCTTTTAAGGGMPPPSQQQQQQQADTNHNGAHHRRPAWLSDLSAFMGYYVR